MVGVSREAKVLLVALTGSLLLSAGTYHYIDRRNAERAQTEFEAVVSEAAQAIRERVSSYEFGARGARGAIVAVGPREITRASFLDYMSTRDLPEEFPGALGFGFIRRVARDELDAFVESARDDGWPNFSVRELAAHAGEHYVIEFIEPNRTNGEAIGLDIGSESNRRMAADLAMRSGEATLTEPITLVQATGKPARGFLLLLPVYDPKLPHDTVVQRERALVGWSYSPLIIDDVLEQLGETLDDFSVSITDPDSDDVTEPFYISERPSYSVAPTTQRELLLFGRRWEMDFRASEHFSSGLGLPNPWVPAGLLFAMCLLATLSARYYFSATRMRRDLQQDQARTVALFNRSGDAIIDLDTRFRVKAANEAAQRLLGSGPGPGEQPLIFDLLPVREGMAPFRQALSQAAGGLVPGSVELDLSGPHDRETHYVALLSPIKGDDGAVTGLSLTLRDISRQRAVEATLSEISVLTSSQLGEAFMHTAASALGRLLRADLVTIDRIEPENTGRAVVLAAYREGATLHPWHFALEDSASSQALPPKGTLRASGGTRVLVDAKGQLPTPLPGVRAASCISLDLHDAGHERFGHLSVFHGTTAVPDDLDHSVEVARLFSQRVESEMRRLLAEQERVAAEARLREVNESLERLAAQRTRELRHSLIIQEKIVGSAGVAMIATDRNGLITLFNPAAEALLGRSSKTMVGMQTPEAFHDPEEVRERAAELSRTLGRPFEPGFEVFVHGVGKDKVTRRDWTYIHASGERIPVLLGISQLQDDDGTVLGYLGVAVDMREQREQAEKLRRAVERSEAATRAKSEFLANVSHEIRTPMNAILGMMQLLENTSLDRRQKEFVRKSENAAYSLLSMLNDVLDFSKIEAGMMVLERQTFSLQTMLSDLSIICEGLAWKPGVEIVFDVDGRLPDRFVGDPLRIKQVLTNLLGNAMKFTDSGSVVLSVRPLSSSDEAWELDFAVRDTGIGIPEHLQAHIFASFAQAEASTARRYGGTGLGLSICDRLVGMMGGRMRLRSVPGSGSTFSFSIALSAAEPGPRAVRNHGLDVLALEPCDVTADVVSSLLRRLGCRVRVMRTLRELEHAWNDRPPDLLLLAWSEGVGHTEFSRVSLARKCFRPGQHTLFATSGSRHTLMLEVENAGLHGVRYLSKPLLLSTLEAVLDSLGADAPGAVRADAADSPDSSASLGSVNVLVVDDNAMNREVVRDILEAEGASVRLHAGGELALHALAAEPDWPHVVLTDIQMPGMDGYELARRIRSDARFSALPILALTAHVTESDRAACFAAGMCAHISKPIDIIEMRAAILSCLGKAETALPASTAERTPAEDIAAARLRFKDHPKAFRGALRAFLSGATGLVDNMLDAGAGASERIRAAHTLKGNAATVGCVALSDVAARAERALRDDEVLSPALESEARHALSGALEGVAFELPAEDPVAPPGIPGLPLSRREQAARLRRLLELLQASNHRALQVAEDLVSQWPVDHAELARKMLDEARHFDFDNAAQRCEALLALLGEELE